MHQLWSSENLLHVKPAPLKRSSFDRLTPGTSAAPRPVTIEPRRPMPLERQGATLFCSYHNICNLYVWYSREPPFLVVSSTSPLLNLSIPSIPTENTAGPKSDR